MEQNERIFIVIVTYNASPWIDECIKSIYESSINAEIVIVDNNSKDETIEIIESKYPFCHLLKLKSNFGFGVANNKGIEFALKMNASFIALLNQDAKLERDALKNLLKAANSCPEFGILSPMFYSYNGEMLDWYMLLAVFPSNNKLATDIFFKIENEVYELDVLMPAAMWLVRSEAFLDVGGFDPAFFMYGEDNDLWDRFKYKKWKVGIAPKSLVYHYSSDKEYSEVREIWKTFANYLLILKTTDKRSFFVIFTRLIKKYFSEFANSLIYWDIKRIKISSKSLYKIICKLSMIKKHREISLKVKMPFLSIDN